MIATPKEELALAECYRRLFKQSTPSADFDELCENATIDEHGRKHIPFNDYELEEDKFDQIIMEVIREFKVKPSRRQAFTATILLGCSPKTKLNKQ
jgi:hypothetical protein